ncbi:FAD-binding oxidoreductase [candidate division KSB1 bacterium]|nr:FAD-binding oxidoreductase [candidate division KSB1 bacterium]
MNLAASLKTILPKNRIRSRLIDRYSYARDAGFYRLIPQVVVQPQGEDEIQSLFEFCRTNGVPLTFRAAGTSLSGQSISDSILVEINQHWRDYRIADDASTITCQAGVVGAQANVYLQPFGRKIGPDPASLASCFIGGIVANNASGMSAGVRGNSAQTLQSMRLILPNGVLIDSADSDADEQFHRKAPEIYTGLAALQQRIRQSKELTDRIRDKYSRKNTTGYALNAFTDFDRPIDILVHLMVGSEGTLGFISSVTLKTFPDKPLKSAALLLFRDIEQAARAVFTLKETGAEALEIMDRAALRSVENEPGLPAVLKTLPPGAAALLCEYQDVDVDALERRLADGRNALKSLDLLYPVDFTRDENERLLYWKVRKGLLPSAGAMRKKGTTVIIEDVGFRLQDLASAIRDLQELFQKHGYPEAIIFGHTEAGNIHFIISQEFADSKGIDQYRRFMDDVIDLTVNKYDGALKTEHGTGRNMAPFVSREWGQEAFAIMQEIKTLFDPQGILNPDVIINDDPECHLKLIKPTPPTEETVDKCIECGFCEIWCPSRDLTLTPRRRIAVLREISILERGTAKERKIAAQLRKQYRYDGIDTCAVDGLCAMGCPVKIDTGDLIRIFRQSAHRAYAHRISMWTVDHFGLVVQLLRYGLKLGRLASAIVGSKNLNRLTRTLHDWSGHRLPVWNGYMPTGAPALPELPQIDNPRQTVVYFPSCLSRGMGPLPEEKYCLSVPETFVRVCTQARIQIRYPKNLEALCCGTPYSSKGYFSAFLAMAKRVADVLYEASQAGSLPVVMDTSPCTYKIKNYDRFLQGETLERWRKVEILDLVEFLHDRVLPVVSLHPVPGHAVLHPTCSTIKMDETEKMSAIANVCCGGSTVPEHHGCCGFAGDRGFLHPPLTESATRLEAQDVRKIDAQAGHFSISRTCEIGMSSAVGTPYSSIVHLLYQAMQNEEKLIIDQ